MARDSASASNQVHSEAGWGDLDKVKFFGFGTALFSGITGMLFPLSVLKTRLQGRQWKDDQVQQGQNLRLYNGMGDAFVKIVRKEGVSALYSGFSTFVIGTIPSRILYLSTLEVVKSGVQEYGEYSNLSKASLMGLSNGIGGFSASLVTQLVVVPIDVISSRLMVQSTGVTSVKYKGGFDALQTIIRTEGIRRGLYRGFGASLITYTPSSSIWWGSYGFMKTVIQQLADQVLPHSEELNPTKEIQRHSNIMALSWRTTTVETSAAVCAGLISGFVSNPLDVIKTRLQVFDTKKGGSSLSLGFMDVASRLYYDEGIRGFYRGVVPRMANVALWGTCMVTGYEFLKRASVRE